MVLGFFMLIDTCLIPFESKKHCFKTLNNNFQNCLYFHFRKFFQEFLVISSDSSQIVVEDKLWTKNGIDNDPQGSLTEALGYPEPDKLEITLATIMEWRHLLSVL